MLRASIIAIVAVSLAACDDESETVVEETGTEVEVTAEAAEEETAETAGDAEQATEATVAEAEETAEDAEGEDEVLTSDSPAVETTILTEADTEQVEGSISEGEGAEQDEEDAGEGADADPAAGSGGDEAEGEDTQAAAPGGGGDEAEGEDTEVAAAETDAEPAAAGGDADAMQRYEEWAEGRWAPSASCESGIVEMEQNTLSLPGNVTCSEVEVASSGEDALAVTGSSCEGAGDLGEVELEVTQTDDGGITVSRDGQEASLVRCE